MKLDKSNIRVADYLTELPEKKLLASKLHQSVERARNKITQQKAEVWGVEFVEQNEAEMKDETEIS